MEEPDFVRDGVNALRKPFEQIFTELYSITKPYQQGTSNWMGVWYPEREYVTSCDFSSMISSDMFRNLMLEELRGELNFLDATIYHVDGLGVLRQLDTLLAEPKIRGIQWVYGAGQPTAAHWIPLLRKIQDAGRLIHIDAYPSDVPVLLKELRPQGLFLNLVGATAAEAEELFALAAKR